MGFSGVLSYLEYAILHKVFVLGFRRNLWSEQAMAEASEMAPVSLTLNDYRITLDNGRWCSDCAEVSYSDGPEDNRALEKQVMKLRNEKQKLSKDLERCRRQTRELDDLKQRWSNLDFKYQLLMDMWTLRALDNEKPKSPNSTRAPTPVVGGTY